jgi:hypothetical protein
MQRDIVSGICLIVGSLASMVIMVLHPTGGDVVSHANFGQLAVLNIGVHSVGIAAAPVLFFGLLGVSRRLGHSDLTNAALVAYGFSGVAVMGAAVASGFVATPVIQQILTIDAASRATYEALLKYTGMWNQGFATVYVVASSVAILLWSAAILKGATIARAAGVAGVAVGVGVLLAFFGGLVRPDAHGFGIVIFAQCGWFIWLGYLQCRGHHAGGRVPGTPC